MHLSFDPTLIDMNPNKSGTRSFHVRWFLALACALGSLFGSASAGCILCQMEYKSDTGYGEKIGYQEYAQQSAPIVKFYKTETLLKTIAYGEYINGGTNGLGLLR